MARVFRRTPTSEEAASYGYRDLLRDVVGKMLAGGAAQSRRMLEGKMTEDDYKDMLLGGVGAGTKIASGLGKGKFPFNLKVSDIDAWTEVFRNPAAAKTRGVKARIEFMSPRKYFEKIQKGEGSRWSVEDYMDDTVRSTISKFAREMQQGAKFPLPGIEHQGKVYAGQEGRHRILAAEMLGIDRVPVLTVKSKGRVESFKKGEVDPIQLITEKFSKQGLKYDAYTEPLPGMGYHQWTLYGEGPAKGATFGTKTTSTEEMTEKIAELLRRFSE